MSRKKYPFAKYFFVVILGCYMWASLVNRLAICPCGKKQRVIKFTNTNCIIHNEISQLRYDRESLCGARVVGRDVCTKYGSFAPLWLNY